MLIGAMNHPAQNVLSEIEEFAQLELDFIDLTLEPPAAAVWQVDPVEIWRSLERHRLAVVGHTAYYLPLATPFEELRRAAVRELERCLEAFAQVGARWMNLHPSGNSPMQSRADSIRQNIRTIEELLPTARRLGIGLMVENLPGDFNSPEQLAELLDPLPELGLHLDIGHANLRVDENTTGRLLARYEDRLRHVHLHDNKGGHADLHLPLGAGTIDVARHIRALKASGYDGTITLEVFSPDKSYLVYSRGVLRQLWDMAR